MKTVTLLSCGLLGLASGGLMAQGVRAELKPVAFSTLDANKDGKISLTEARAEPDLEMAFDGLDQNHDGFLTPKEFERWTRAAKSKEAKSDPTTGPSGSAGAQHMPGTPPG